MTRGEPEEVASSITGCGGVLASYFLILVSCEVHFWFCKRDGSREKRKRTSNRLLRSSMTQHEVSTMNRLAFTSPRFQDEVVDARCMPPKLC